MEIRRYRGLWWLPSNPDKKIYGILTQNYGEYPTLSLDGSFTDHREEGGDFYEMILGLFENKKMTLINCLRFHASFTRSVSGDFSHSEFQVRLFCIGKHYPKKSGIQFTCLNVKYSHLKEWLSTAFQISVIKQSKDEFVATIKRPLEYEVALSDFTLKIRGVIEGSSGLYHDSFIKTALISIHSEKAHLEKFFRIIRDISNFLGLAIGEEISINEISQSDEGTKIELIIPDLMENGKDEDKISFHPLPIEFGLISDEINFYLENWFSFIKKYEPVYQLYIAGIDRRVHPITRFLNFSQALEAYHSRKYDDRLFPDEVLREVDKSTCFCAKIAENLEDTRSQTSFKAKFSFLNRKSLRMRMRELFKDFSQTFSIFIKDESKFISKFADTRNYYTHYDPQTNIPIEQGKLSFLIDDLHLILIAIIATEIGFNQNQTQRIARLYGRKRIQKTFALF